MTATLLALMLSIQLITPFPPASQPRTLTDQPAANAIPRKVWWGLIDPELALWFSRIPQEESDIFLWDWSWRGFLAALFPQPLVKEAPHAPSI